MDTRSRVIPLLPDDANAQSMPLVGIWIGGRHSVTHPSCVAACLRFHFTSRIKDKATVNGCFLALLYGKGDYSARLYECKIDENTPHQKVAYYACRVFGRRSAGPVDVKIKWKLESTGEGVAAIQSKTVNPPESSVQDTEPVAEALPCERRAEFAKGTFFEEIPFSFSAHKSPQHKRYWSVANGTGGKRENPFAEDFRFPVPAGNGINDAQTPPDAPFESKAEDFSMPHSDSCCISDFYKEPARRHGQPSVMTPINESTSLNGNRSPDVECAVSQTPILREFLSRETSPVAEQPRHENKAESGAPAERKETGTSTLHIDESNGYEIRGEQSLLLQEMNILKERVNMVLYC